MEFRDNKSFGFIDDGSEHKPNSVLISMLDRAVRGALGDPGGCRVWFQDFIVETNVGYNLAASRQSVKVGRHGWYYGVRQVDGQVYHMKENGLILEVPMMRVAGLLWNPTKTRDDQDA